MSLRILVADDDADMVDVLRMALDTMGHTAVTSTTARSSIEQLAAGGFDGVLLDLTMPDLPPERLVSAILGIADRPPIVVFSARAEEETREFAQRLGAAMLTKPCELNDLLDAIDTNFVGAKAGAGKTARWARADR